MRTAHDIAGVAGDVSLAAETIVIQSVAVSAQRKAKANGIDFLNSFFLEDLATVLSAVAKNNFGSALASYLTSGGTLNEQERIDVILTREAIDEGVAADRLPKGRWLSDPAHSLSLRQQFAVNHALNELASDRGLMGVNGPPGTGKTTMLRDILAGNIVERARKLAAFARPEDAFTSEEHCWTARNGYARSVRQLRPELTGYEMVVASANNAVVENVTREIPAHGAINCRWHGEADYFADIATDVLAEINKENSSASKTDAWGLIAGPLGNKDNRSAFYSALWFDEKVSAEEKPSQSSSPRMQTRLAEWSKGPAPHRSWNEARERFTHAEDRVKRLLMDHEQAQHDLR